MKQFSVLVIGCFFYGIVGQRLGGLSVFQIVWYINVYVYSDVIRITQSLDSCGYFDKYVRVGYYGVFGVNFSFVWVLVLSFDIICCGLG